MEPETGYPKETSSNSDGTSGLSNPNEDPWTPEETDDSPTITIKISDEDTYIESATITGTDNVESVTVVIVADDGSEVCLKSLPDT
jgi:hypothetical protein